MGQLNKNTSFVKRKNVVFLEVTGAGELQDGLSVMCEHSYEHLKILLSLLLTKNANFAGKAQDLNNYIKGAWMTL